MSFESPDIDSDDERKRDSSRKRDGKRDKREKGYQMFEAEDSDDEPLALVEDLKSPSKQKKERSKPSFKFPVSVRKEKTKEKDDKKDKDAKHEEKEKKKEEKEKKKHKKDKKKPKHSHKDTPPALPTPSITENPIFGVPLAVAVERNKSHDGIELPALVRECIDYIEEYGLACEGIYRMSGVKSKVQHLKESYNRGEHPHLLEHEPNVVASLLKLFLRELPEPVLTPQLLPKFEEASTIKFKQKKIESFTRIIADLPTCNRLLLSWMIVHMTHVIELAKENKMNLQNVSIVLSPTMQISHRVLNVLFSHSHELFGDIQLRKYVPPLKPAHSKWSLELPDNLTALEEELAKQESLLNQLHAELHSGREDPNMSEQLWEVQRVVTQLKRKIKMGKKNVELVERRKANMDAKRSSNTSLPSLSAPEELHLDLRPAPAAVTTVTTTVQVERQPDNIPAEDEKVDDTEENKEISTGGAVSQDAASAEIENKSDEGKEEKVEVEQKDNAVADDKGKIATSKKGEKFAPEAPLNNSEVEKPSEKENIEIEKEKKEDAVVQNSDGEIITAEAVAEEKNNEIKIADKTEDKVKDEKEEGEQQVKSDDKEVETLSGGDIQLRQESSSPGKNRASVECKESEAEKTVEKGKHEVKKAVLAREDSITVEEGQIVKSPPIPSTDATTSADHRDTLEETQDETNANTATPEKKKETPKKVVKFMSPKPESPSEELASSESNQQEKSAHIVNKPKESSQLTPSEKQAQTNSEIPPVSPTSRGDLKTSKPTVKKYEYRKAPNPPFVSTSLLKPMKAEPPKPQQQKSASLEEVSSPQHETEKWRELEEELLGQNKDEEEEEAEIQRLLEEEYALQLEEEELLAIGDELRQKLATEHSEMERLSQEIQELQYLRQDSDLEDLSSASSVSSDSEDDEDLQDLLSQLIQDNQELEMQSADMCQKIHEERMICLQVKLQIRLLQQKQLESSCG